MNTQELALRAWHTAMEAQLELARMRADWAQARCDAYMEALNGGTKRHDAFVRELRLIAGLEI